MRERRREVARSVKGTGIAVRHGQRTEAADEADAMPGPPRILATWSVSPDFWAGGSGAGMIRSSIGTC